MRNSSTVKWLIYKYLKNSNSNKYLPRKVDQISKVKIRFILDSESKNKEKNEIYEELSTPIGESARIKLLSQLKMELMKLI